MILFDETIRQSPDDGRRFVDLLSDAGVIPGIKVDTGAKALASFPGETVTEGLDGLRERLGEYAGLGARFAKWRATSYFIGDGLPTETAIGRERPRHGPVRRALPGSLDRADRGARDPDGRSTAYDVAACADATGRTLDALFPTMVDQRVDLAGTLFKVNMVLSGYGASDQSGRTMSRLAPSHARRARPDRRAGRRLPVGWTVRRRCHGAPERDEREAHPWELSFSYGRALQAPALKAWGGKPESLAAGQRAYYHRAKLNSAARSGTYSPRMEPGFVAQLDLRVCVHAAVAPPDSARPGRRQLLAVSRADRARRRGAGGLRRSRVSGRLLTRVTDTVTDYLTPGALYGDRMGSEQQKPPSARLRSGSYGSLTICASAISVAPAARRAQPLTVPESTPARPDLTPDGVSDPNPPG